mmetsp:Transcript_3819/g.4929  ORF Transcript_3819/g.4929 Transcript_3819/m.4929 type:complete len:112 (-) Transcript_3819:52-387(-)
MRQHQMKVPLKPRHTHQSAMDYPASDSSVIPLMMMRRYCLDNTHFLDATFVDDALLQVDLACNRTESKKSSQERENGHPDNLCISSTIWDGKEDHDHGDLYLNLVSARRKG